MQAEGPAKEDPTWPLARLAARRSSPTPQQRARATEREVIGRARCTRQRTAATAATGARISAPSWRGVSARRGQTLGRKWHVRRTAQQALKEYVGKARQKKVKCRTLLPWKVVHGVKAAQRDDVDGRADKDSLARPVRQQLQGEHPAAGKSEKAQKERKSCTQRRRGGETERGIGCRAARRPSFPASCVQC